MRDVETNDPRRRDEPGDRDFVCAECGRSPSRHEDAEDSWRAYSDGVGELHVFCPECAEREFGRIGPLQESGQ